MDLRRGSRLSWLAGMIIVVLTTIVIMIIILWLAGVYCVHPFSPRKSIFVLELRGDWGQIRFPS
jgi:hypothetical protein